MDVLRIGLLLLHMAGMAVLLGGFLLQTMAGVRRMVPVIFHGAGFQLLTGLLLVGVTEMDDERAVNHAKIAVKLGIALLVVGLTHANRRREVVPAGVFYGTFALAAANAVIAYSWV